MRFKILIIVLILSFVNITTLYSQKNYSAKADIAFNAGQ